MSIKNFSTPYIIEKTSDRTATWDVFSKLLKDQRIIFISEAIDAELASVIKAQLLYLSSDPNEDITIYIDSPGGEVYSGLGIYDTIRFIPNKVNTICTGMAASMALILLLAGDKRGMLPNSRLMCHQPIGGVHGQQSDIEIVSEEIKFVRETLENIIIERSSVSKEDVKKYTDRDYWIGPDKAIELGFIDKVISYNKK